MSIVMATSHAEADGWTESRYFRTRWTRETLSEKKIRNKTWKEIVKHKLGCDTCLRSVSKNENILLCILRGLVIGGHQLTTWT